MYFSSHNTLLNGSSCNLVLSCKRWVCMWFDHNFSSWSLPHSYPLLYTLHKSIYLWISVAILLSSQRKPSSCMFRVVDLRISVTIHYLFYHSWLILPLTNRSKFGMCLFLMFSSLLIFLYFFLSILQNIELLSSSGVQWRILSQYKGSFQFKSPSF